MRNILLPILLLASILLTVYLWNRTHKKQQEPTSQTTDTIAINQPSTRILDKGEFANLLQIDNYADSVIWQHIPTGNMEMSPGFYDDNSYYATEFRGAYPSGIPIFAVQTLRKDDEKHFTKTMILKNGKIVRIETTYDLDNGGFGLGKRLNYFDENGNYLGTKEEEISGNTETNKVDTLIKTFYSLDNNSSPINPNELMDEVVNTSYGRGDYALKFEGIRKDSEGTYIQTSTFNKEWNAEFIVQEKDETFKKLTADSDKYIGKIIQIEKAFGFDIEKGGRKNYYNGGKIFE